MNNDQNPKFIYFSYNKRGDLVQVTKEQWEGEWLRWYNSITKEQAKLSDQN